MADVTTIGIPLHERTKELMRAIPTFNVRIGDIIAGRTKELIGRHKRSKLSFDRSGMWKRSVGHEVKGNSVEVFYDLGQAPYARMRELGGTITAFNSKFKNRKTGQPLLFIPLTKGSRPATWKMLTFGKDYVLKHSVTQRGTFEMKNAILDMLVRRPALLEKRLGVIADKAMGDGK